MLDRDLKERVWNALDWEPSVDAQDIGVSVDEAVVTVFPMASAGAPIITCPVCESSGEMIHHDIRAALVYFCRTCSHEWQIDPADEPPEPALTAAERPRTPSRTKQSRPRNM